MSGFEDFSSVAARLRAYLQGRVGLSDADLDTGLPRQVWAPDDDFDGVSDSAPVIAPGAPDGTVTDAEVFRESFCLLERLRFGSPTFASEITASGDAAQDFYGHYARVARYFPPWLIDDGDSATAGDRDLRTAIDQIVGTAHGDVDVLLRSLRRPRSEGGLGLLYRFDPGNTHRRRDAVEAYAAGFGDCNAFSFLFYALAARAGLRPVFIRITGERTTATGPFDPIHHVGVAVRLNPASDELTPCDPSHRVCLDEALYQWYALTPREMLAGHLRNVALYNESDPDEQERVILQAYALAPNSFDIAHDVAWFYEHVLHSPTRAAPYLRRAVEINPSLQPNWETEP